MGSFGIGGVAASGGAGLDVQSLVDQVLYGERAPVRLLQAQQRQLDARAAALRDINAKLLNLEAKVNELRDLSGKFNSKTAGLSQTGILTATAGAQAAVASHVILVSTLATRSSYYSDQLATGSTTFNTGSFDLQIGTGVPTTITVDTTNNTLDLLAASMNSLSLGVSASVISDANGARLSLLSDSSGAPGDLAISNNTSGLAFTKAVTGRNATLTVDGVPVSSAGNTVSTVIPGMTLDLLSAAPETPVTLTVEADTAQARQAVEEFVAGYNSLIQAINAQFSYNFTTKQAGVLSGDGTLRSVQTRLLQDINASITGNGGFVNLSTIGVDLANDGTLTVDSAALDEALASHFTEVKNLLQSLAPSGVAQTFSADLNSLTDSVDGPVNIALTGIADSQTTIADQIREFEFRLNQRRLQLTEQFGRLDAMLRQLPLILSQINNQLNTLR